MPRSDYHIGVISSEQFVTEHTFAYIINGEMHLYDGSNNYVLKSGECVLARKNRLIRFKKEKVNGELEKVFVFFDGPFLKAFQEKHQPGVPKFQSGETILRLPENRLLPNFIQSLLPYYNHGKITETFADVKREELLLILLQAQPELAGLFFDYGIPEKINIEEFMNRNYQFNVSIERFAYLTGRSLSVFKRDFKQIFNDTPSHWLVQRRLQEAYFLIDKKNQKPTKIYLELGFETLPHFSYAFKKYFGVAPTELAGQKSSDFKRA
ncbi:helix-turn-helix transcriptional regulator [Mucilaginibacter sp. HC2]|uniref:helix-turn-helix domain-containing protein n=1 Tax=Mucilaginibacter inviolabilis TaxID=2714892 RepID=UPI00140AD707|nr:AraC family transcriptional regulator [Mucilaginibacter inviolabilis]NHA06178.1 helix-turn-helix transcriptional regulator [Mucilaginibacter inviolabilis]